MYGKTFGTSHLPMTMGLHDSLALYCTDMYPFQHALSGQLLAS